MQNKFINTNNRKLSATEICEMVQATRERESKQQLLKRQLAFIWPTLSLMVVAVCTFKP